MHGRGRSGKGRSGKQGSATSRGRHAGPGAGKGHAAAAPGRSGHSPSTLAAWMPSCRLPPAEPDEFDLADIGLRAHHGPEPDEGGEKEPLPEKAGAGRHAQSADTDTEIPVLGRAVCGREGATTWTTRRYAAASWEAEEARGARGARRDSYGAQQPGVDCPW